jgi:hypothetical protein
MRARHNRSVTRAAPFVALLLTAGLAAGCGSSDTPTTAAAYTKDAKAICSSVDNSGTINAVKQISASRASQVTKLEKLLVLDLPFISKLEAIKPPAGDAAAAKLHQAIPGFLGDVKQIQADAKSHRTTTEQRDETTIEAVDQTVDADLTSVGVNNCS